MLKIERILDKKCAVAPTLPVADLAARTPYYQPSARDLDDGGDAGLFLPRGSSLQHGDYLQGDQGELIRASTPRNGFHPVLR